MSPTVLKEAGYRFFFFSREELRMHVHISSHSVWLLTDQEELFMSYQDFPWFKNQPVNAIIEVEEVSQGHFYWSKIDIDLTVEMIKNPAKFPLVAR